MEKTLDKILSNGELLVVLKGMLGSKSIQWGASNLRPEATGYGVVYTCPFLRALEITFVVKA